MCSSVKCPDISRFLDWMRQFSKTQPQIEKIILYGSFARKDATPCSDIDLAFILKEHKKWFQIVDQIEEGAPTLRSLDLICLQAKHVSLKKKVNKEWVLVYEKRKDKTKLRKS